MSVNIIFVKVFSIVLITEGLLNKAVSKTTSCIEEKDCGKPNTTEIYIPCHHHIHPLDRECCKASQPENLKYKLSSFHNAEGTIDVLFSWEAPLYGTRYHWGYEIHINELNPGHVHTDSCQHILKKVNGYVGKGFKPGRSYEVLVLSLPRYSFGITKNASLKVTMPDLCSLEKQYGFPQSLKCFKILLKEQSKDCDTGTFEVSWDTKRDNYFKKYLLEWRKINSSHWKQITLQKNITTYRFSGLRKEEEYKYRMYLWKGLGKTSSPSNILTFSCLVPPTKITVVSFCEEGKANTSWNKPPHSTFDNYVLRLKREGEKNWKSVILSKKQGFYTFHDLEPGHRYEIKIATQKNGRESTSLHAHPHYCKVTRKDPKFVIISIVFSTVFVFTMVITAICCRLRHKLWKQNFPRTFPSVETITPIEDEKGPKVLVLHYRGCKYVGSLALLFIKLLRSVGIPAISYEHETSEVHDSTPAGYLNKKFDEVEYTITFYTEQDTSMDDAMANLYRQAVVLCTNSSYNQNSKPKHISFYLHLRNGLKIFGDYSVNTYQCVPNNLKPRSYKFPKEIPEIVERLLCPGRSVLWPHRENINLDKSLLNLLEQFTFAALAAIHKDCYKPECSKGVQTYPEVSCSFEKEVTHYSDSSSIDSFNKESVSVTHTNFNKLVQGAEKENSLHSAANQSDLSLKLTERKKSDLSLPVEYERLISSESGDSCLFPSQKSQLQRQDSLIKDSTHYRKLLNQISVSSCNSSVV